MDNCVDRVEFMVSVLSELSDLAEVFLSFLDTLRHALAHALYFWDIQILSLVVESPPKV